MKRSTLETIKITETSKRAQDEDETGIPTGITSLYRWEPQSNTGTELRTGEKDEEKVFQIGRLRRLEKLQEKRMKRVH